MFGITNLHLCKEDISKNSHMVNYCGTCKSIGAQYGQTSRLFLNNDVVFLTALLNAHQENHTINEAYKNKSCFALPSKRNITKVYDYTASLNLFLAAIKIEDNINDANKLSKYAWESVNNIHKKSIKQAKLQLEKYGLDITHIKEYLRLNLINEHKENLTLAEYIKPTKEITGLCFENGARLVSEDSNYILSMSTIGQQLGKIVYLQDAIDDFEKDKSEGQFNPILKSNLIQKGIVKDELSSAIKQIITALKNLDINKTVKKRYLNLFAKLEAEEVNEEEKKKKKSGCFLDGCYCDCDLCCCCDCCSIDGGDCCDC